MGMTMSKSLPEYMTTREAAKYLRLAEVTLRKWRSKGTGPRFRRHGARVLYARENLDNWSRRQIARSTVDKPSSRPVEAPLRGVPAAPSRA